MANRQYIGARYVPKVFNNNGSSDWVSGIAYEPLTIVTLLGNSYTSVKPVPSTIGSPNLNPQYWANTGNYNAGMANLQNEIDALDDRVDYLSNFVTPQMFGAKGDGSTDDTEAIKECFESDLKYVYIPLGNYLVTDTIEIPDGFVVRGEGTLISRSEYYPKVNVGNNCDVQINVDEKMDSYSMPFDDHSNVIEINNKSNVIIRDCKVINVGSRFAIHGYQSTNITIVNCYVDTYVYGAICANTSCDGVKILHNTVLNGHGNAVNRYPIGVGGVTANSQICKNVIISDNYIEDDEPKWEGIDSHGCVNLIITNNVIKNCLTGIAVVKGANDVVSENVIVANNTYEFTKTGNFGDSNTFGISCEIHTNSNGVIIANNIIKQTGNNGSVTGAQGGMYIAGTATIIGNRILMNKGRGIYLVSTATCVAKNFKICDNVLEGDGTAIAMKFNNTNLYDIIGEVYNNVIDNFETGIDGNEYYGSGSDYLNSVYCYQNTIVNVTNEILHNSRGTFLDHGESRNRFMRRGQIIFNVGASSVSHWICTTSATSESAAVVKEV